MMKTLYPVPPDPSTDPVYLAAAAVHSLIQPLPAGTAFCIGVVLIVMMTGRLVQTKGSLARAVLPFVVHLHWGWHRVERAMERGKFSLDAMFDLASDWCLRQVLGCRTFLSCISKGFGGFCSQLLRLRTGKLSSAFRLHSFADIFGHPCGDILDSNRGQRLGNEVVGEFTAHAGNQEN